MPRSTVGSTATAVLPQSGFCPQNRRDYHNHQDHRAQPEVIITSNPKAIITNNPKNDYNGQLTSDYNIQPKNNYNEYPKAITA